MFSWLTTRWQDNYCPDGIHRSDGILLHDAEAEVGSEVGSGKVRSPRYVSHTCNVPNVCSYYGMNVVKSRVLFVESKKTSKK